MTTEREVPVFTYTVDLDERGEFQAHVDDPSGKTVYEIQSGADGEVTQIEDGYMKHVNDLAGLEDYLKDLKIMPEDAELQ